MRAVPDQIRRRPTPLRQHLTPARFAATDSSIRLESYPVPSEGAYSYANLRPSQPGFLQVGESYIDPAFCSEIARMTAHFPNEATGNHYVKNGFWSADSTMFAASDWSSAGSLGAVFNAATGDVITSSRPGDADLSFDPVDPDVLYYFSGSSIMQYSVTSEQSTLLHTFGGTLGSLGGSVDWISADGRYFVVLLGTQATVWDKQDDVEYTGGPSGAVGAGWLAMSPDGNWLVVAGNDGHRSYAIDHGARSVVSSGTVFWTLCGDHGDLVSASNGKTYMVTFECHSDPGVFAVDVALAQSGDSEADRQKQRDDSTRLIQSSWTEYHDGHIAGVARGPMRDWAIISLVSTNATTQEQYTNDPNGPWLAYMNEIMGNVLTGEVRRLAHHRTDNDGYCSTPRASVDWDGTKVLFASNFGEDSDAPCGYADMWVIKIPD